MVWFKVDRNRMLMLHKLNYCSCWDSNPGHWTCEVDAKNVPNKHGTPLKMYSLLQRKSITWRPRWEGNYTLCLSLFVHVFKIMVVVYRRFYFGHQPCEKYWFLVSVAYDTGAFLDNLFWMPVFSVGRAPVFWVVGPAKLFIIIDFSDLVLKKSRVFQTQSFD